jgi:lysozyme
MDPVTAQIAQDEGLRLQVYDDATGKPIKPGDKVIGNPTIGYGCLLCAPGGITKDEALALLNARVAKARALAETIPVYAKLDPVRQGVLVQMVYQMGLGGVLGFENTLAYMAAGDWKAAADGMRHSKWAQQTPKRAERLAREMETGNPQ